MARDDECASGQQCALNALQQKATSKVHSSLEEDSINNESLKINNHGYQNFATTTVYGDSAKTACGGLNSADLVRGTPYHNVASAQSMWLGCKDHGNCWCGKSGGGAGTTGMGCFQCGKGRFLRSAYGRLNHALFASQLEAHEGSEEDAGSPFATDEVIFVVGDLCPTLGNDDWCPRHPGQRNAYGSLHHFDFSHYPKIIDHPGSVANLNFVWSPTDCPGELKGRFYRLSQCR